MADLPSLAGADFLRDPQVEAVFRALARDGEETRIIGGAVRDALLGLPVRDVDFGTTLTPPQTEARARGAGLKAVPTGAEHGTITVVVDGRGFEVTTLRADIATDGRHAVVRFGRDWTEDARRRDFTLNALSVDAAGTVFDPLGGYPDLAARRIRFIGEAEKRIAEDRLRVLRFFRFMASFGEGVPDAEGLGAAIRARYALRELSSERVAQEMRKLLLGRRAPEIVELMEETGILELVLAGVARLAAFGRLPSLEAALGATPSAEIRLLVLSCRIAEDIERAATRLRLSGAERRRMEAAFAAAGEISGAQSDRAARRILYRHGTSAYLDGVLVAAAIDSVRSADVWKRLFVLPEVMPVPSFPLSGRDALAVGIPAGPAVGSTLAALENWWISEDFQPDEAALRRRLQEIVQSTQ